MSFNIYNRKYRFIHLLLLVILVTGNCVYMSASRPGIAAPRTAAILPSDTVDTDKIYIPDLIPADSSKPAGRPRILERDSLVQPIPTRAVPKDTVQDSTTAISAPTTTPIDSLPLLPRLVQRSGSRFITEKVDLTAPVNFESTDSVVMIGRDLVFLYGDAKVTYDELKLDAAEVKMDLRTNDVYAMGKTDSTGEVIGSPVFEEKGTPYESETMSYNFKTQKGYITNVVTQQGEGYITGGRAKKIEDDSFFFEDGKYSTCDNHDHPHFYLQLTKARMKPGKNVVTGPAYMVLAGLPLPIAVPFGYFPFSENYASGIIVPTFGDDYNRGFYLSNGGYYFAINDNIDLALTGEIYTRGSWGLNAQSTYNRRYKFNGQFSVNYLTTISGDKGQSDYSKATNLQVRWSHTQDAKFNPNMTLSASVNFTTSGYTRNDLNSYYSSGFTENTKSSTVNMTYRFPNSKWSLSTNLNISQRTQDSTLSVSFPNVTVTMSQLYPFKRKRAVGDEKWYEKIRMSYSGQFQNSLTANQSVFFQKSLIKDWRNGMKHNIPLSATFNLFKYINLTPSVTLNDRMYTTKVRRQWDPNAAAEVCDTTYSLYNVWDFNASVSMDTKIYGFFQPLPFLGDKIKMIRHVMTPTVSFNASPDFSSPFFGYYGNYEYTNNQGETVNRKYSYFQNSLYGVPGQGKTGSVSFALANNLEMKVKSDNDSIGEKKISLIENLNISQSYNFAADSLNWSNINTSILLKLTKGFNLNLAAVWDVYTYQLNSAGNPVRVNIPRWKAGKGIGRLSSTGTSFSYTFNNDTFKNLFGKGKDSNKNNKNNPVEEDDPLQDEEEDQRPRGIDHHHDEDQAIAGSDGYMAWNVPWSLSINYSVNYGYGAFNTQKMEYDGKLTQNLSFSGSLRPTANWNFSFSASYNFDTHKIAYMNCNISRDLHCFTMSASVIPVGPYKSFNFHIAVKSSLLSDLKYDKRSSTSTGVRWY